MGTGEGEEDQVSASGRQFLQIPGPTNVPDRILRAMDRPVIDHRGPEFADLIREILPPLKEVFGTREGAPVIYPSSGTGAWEASLVNVLLPGERVLLFNNGHFSTLFAQTARNLGFEVDEVSLRWGQEVPAEEVESRLRADTGGNPYAAVLVVHNETSTGVTSDIGAIRAAMNAAGHDSLLIVDTVSSLASMEFKQDEWGVDVVLTGSQKGLMLPPGLALLSAGPRALARSESHGSPRNFFDWRPIISDNEAGFFPYTPATLLLYGLREALRMLVEEEGVENVYARHRLLAEGVREAVSAWGLRNLCENPRNYSNTLTAVVVPEDKDSDEVMRVARERFGMALGVGLSKLKGDVFRIGHLGSLNELEVIGTLGGVEMALSESGIPVEPGKGVAAAQRRFMEAAAQRTGGRDHVGVS